MRKLRGNKISMIFQEPMSSLNPIYTIGQQIVEGSCILHKHEPRARPMQRALDSCSRKCRSPSRRRGSSSIRISSPAASASA